MLENIGMVIAFLAGLCMICLIVSIVTSLIRFAIRAMIGIMVFAFAWEGFEVSKKIDNSPVTKFLIVVKDHILIYQNIYIGIGVLVVSYIFYSKIMKWINKEEVEPMELENKDTLGDVTV